MWEVCRILINLLSDAVALYQLRRLLLVTSWYGALPLNPSIAVPWVASCDNTFTPCGARAYKECQTRHELLCVYCSVNRGQFQPRVGFYHPRLGNQSILSSPPASQSRRCSLRGISSSRCRFGYNTLRWIHPY